MSARRDRCRVEGLKKHVRGKLSFNEPMSRHTTFGVGGPADAFFIPESKEDITGCLRQCREMGLPVTVIGNGSNLLVRDGGIRGVVICTTALTAVRLLEKDSSAGRALVAAECGLLMSRLLNFCVSQGLSGLEFTTGIPGTVGGAVIMNAGAFGSSLGDAIVWVELMDEDGQEQRIQRREIACDYRSCILPRVGSIYEVGFGLAVTSEQAVLDKIKELLQERGRKLPFGWMSAGSVFKNPPDDYAGRIIEEMGFKGMRVGGAEVSEQHANVIINRGSATARDILNLMAVIQQEYNKRTGQSLVPELRILGEG